MPEGFVVQLQIEVLISGRSALHFEIVDRNADGDLVRLLDDSTVRMKGLDRKLWVPDPMAWCGDL